MVPWISLALMVLAGLGLVLRHGMAAIAGFDLTAASAVIGIIGLLMFSGRQSDSSVGEDRGRAARSGIYRQPLIVASLTGLILAGYFLFDPALRFLSGTPDTETALITPTRSAAPAPTRAALRLRRKSNGMFAARSRVNGTAITLRVDTGATTVVLRAEDARRIGIDTSTLDYTVPVKTAYGTSFAAPARLSRVFVGPLGASDVAALIAKPGKLDVSLLGMSFLNRLRSYSVEGNYLTLEG